MTEINTNVAAVVAGAMMVAWAILVVRRRETARRRERRGLRRLALLAVRPVAREFEV